MRGMIAAIAVFIGLSSASVRAEVMEYGYECDVLPYYASAGWEIYDACEDECNELVENGHFALFRPEPGDRANYRYLIAHTPYRPPLRPHSGSSGATAPTISSTRYSTTLTVNS
ncbi:MAG: hypothetical protein JSU63_11845 [Phycisphaerales bacterium]|nr:MAG: hypothetical protein JSU63_11845 [Phycisphaerales bacterium]